jgi:magnesium transporter
MTVITARRYTHGRPSDHALTIDGNSRTTLEHGSFDWIGLCEPDEDEMDRLAAQFGLHPLAVEDALNPRQLPKAEAYGKQLFIVARTAELTATEVIDYGQTAIFLGSDFIITVRFGSTRAHNDLRRDLEKKPDRMAEGPDYVLHALLDFIVDGYLPIMDRLDDVAVEMEEEAIDAFPEQATIRRIFRLRRQLRRFERVIGPMEEVCDRLAVHELPAIDPAARVFFRDVLDHDRRVMARMRALKDALEAIVETASLLEQHRQGEMTRQLAAWAAILAVPTAIAGVYGMNFQNMPELHWKYGYFMVLSVIVTICVGLFVRFRKIGWL